MREILGNNLSLAFQTLKIQAKQTYKGSLYEVWELSEEDYEALCKIDDNDWPDEFGWWRWGECILEGSTLYAYTVNNQRMLGYIDEHFMNLVGYDHTHYTSVEHESFRIWLSHVFHLGADRHIACFAISLAKENNMSLSEFMKTYQP